MTQQSRRQPVPIRRTLAAALAIVGAVVVALVGAQSVRADAPTFSGDVNATIEATSGSGAPFSFTVTASDPLNDVGPVTCDHASGSTFPLGVTTVTCNATDPDPTVGTVSTSFTVTVQHHRTPHRDGRRRGPSGTP